MRAAPVLEAPRPHLNPQPAVTGANPDAAFQPNCATCASRVSHTTPDQGLRPLRLMERQHHGPEFGTRQPQAIAMGDILGTSRKDERTRGDRSACEGHPRTVRGRRVVSVNTKNRARGTASGRACPAPRRTAQARDGRPSDARAQPQRDDRNDPPPPPKPPRRPGRPVAVLPAQALDKLRKAGGANGGLAKVLGISKSTAHRLIHQLADMGHVRLDAGPCGVRVALA